MIIIDGAKGEGGGQVLRSALSLSACTGQPFRIKNIRGRRKKPGLLRQHLTCVRATETVCGGKATGAHLGSTELSFVPGDIRAGAYAFDIGSAGSTGLVFQTLLPILLQADDASHVTFGGGTHNKSAPPYEFLVETFLPALARSGVSVTTELVRRGFFPAGGGEWSVKINPLEAPTRVKALERGALVSITVEAGVANLRANIAERELGVVQECLGLEDSQLFLRSYDAVGPGNIVLIRVQHEMGTVVFAGFGEHGITAEKLAKRASGLAQRFLDSGAAVPEHLADQLLLPFAAGGGGAFTMEAPSPHFSTNVEVIESFLDVDICVAQKTETVWQAEISS